MDKLKQWYHRIAHDKRFTAALSIALALLTWVVVVTVIDPNQLEHYDVSIDWTSNAAYLRGMGLDIIEKSNKKIRITVEGNRLELASLSDSDFRITPDYAEINGPGEYRLKLNIQKETQYAGYEITQPTDIQYINVVVDKVITQKFAISVNAGGVSIPADYYMDTPVTSPKEVTVSGVESEVLRVDKIVANVPLNEQRTESVIATANLVLLDKDGNPIQSDKITMDVHTVDVTIPVYKIKELPLTVSYAGMPAGFDTNLLGAKLSQNTIRVAGPAAVVDPLTQIEAGIINLATFKLGESATLNIALPETLRNIDSLQSITVSFDTVGYKSIVVSVTDVRAVNVPAGLEVKFPNKRVNNVVLVGKASELDVLNETSVVAQVDLSSYNTSGATGQQTLPVQIVVPSSETVFATGSYKVLCEISTQ